MRRSPDQDLVVWIREHSILDPATGCLNWQGAKSAAGYGQIRVGGKSLYVHRIMLEATQGPLQPGECACHRCDNRGCANPEHLFRGSKLDNNRDMYAKKRHHYGEICSWSKLTDQQVLEIRSSSEMHKILAERYGVTANYICMLKNPDKWGKRRASYRYA